ncbi:MAG: twin-arginine translocation pathway signal protein [Methylococcaceae bacterium]|nr:twin-arginine translocation pathway signal protein [Methylococcaceae bacterium]
MLSNQWSIIALITVLFLTGCQTTGERLAPSGAEIDREVDTALSDLYATTPAARTLAKRAKGILVFPNIVKAGFMFGGQYGRGGALRKRGRTVGYYNSVSASYGLQAGIQSFGYALFFMNDAALSYLDQTGGWEIGVGPSIVVVDAAIARSLTTMTAKDNIYAFIFDQKGLMAGLGLQGSKITRINPD